MLLQRVSLRKITTKLRDAWSTRGAKLKVRLVLRYTKSHDPSKRGSVQRGRRFNKGAVSFQAITTTHDGTSHLWPLYLRNPYSVLICMHPRLGEIPANATIHKEQCHLGVLPYFLSSLCEDFNMPLLRHPKTCMHVFEQMCLRDPTKMSIHYTH